MIHAPTAYTARRRRETGKRRRAPRIGPTALPPDCLFHPRRPHAMPRCHKQVPVPGAFAPAAARVA